MATQKSAPDETQCAAVARLTAKERECLAQWLTHATAKEIAIDLGISHHAVEKRLKSARQKLGVSTTLDAARLLALVEGYGRTASQSSEVVACPGIDQGPIAEPVQAMPAPGASQHLVYAGVIIMSLSLLVAFAVGFGGVESGAVGGNPAALPHVTMVDKRTAKAGDLEAAFAKVFTSFDKDGSGYLDAPEQANAKLRTMRQQSGGAAQSAPQSVAMAQWDSNGDARVSRDEFVAGLASLTARPR